MKNLSSLIRNAVIATAMVLMPSAASAWYYCDLISSDGVTITTVGANTTLNSDGNGFTFYLDLTNLSSNSDFLFYFMAYTDKSSGLNSSSCVNMSPTAWTTNTNYELTSGYSIGSNCASTSSVSSYWYISGGAGYYVTLNVVFYDDNNQTTFSASKTASDDVTYVDPTALYTYTVYAAVGNSTYVNSVNLYAWSTAITGIVSWAAMTASSTSITDSYGSEYKLYSYTFKTTQSSIYFLLQAVGTSSSNTWKSDDYGPITFLADETDGTTMTIYVKWDGVSDNDIYWDDALINVLNGSSSSTKSYYLYIPDIHGSTITACETESFKFSNERVRQGGSVLTNFLSYNIQEFVLKNKLNVGTSSSYDLKFYIWDGTTLYGAWSSDEGYTDIRSCTYKGSSESDWTTATGNWQLNYLGNVDSYLYSDCYEYTPSNGAVPSDAYPFMMTLFGDSYSTTKKHQSVTLMLYTSSGPRLRACFNDSYFGLESDDSYDRYDTSGYYLVGNFDAATANEDINPFSTDNKKTMTKYYYYNSGNYSTTAPTSYDSIVYKTTVTAPSGGFSGLYLVVFPKTFLDNFPGGSDDTYDNTEDDGTMSDNDGTSYTRATIWYRAIRPQEEFYYTTPGLYPTGGYDGLDGTALHGGLYARQSSYITYDTQQAFNPSELESVTSLTFSMNVTTSTYNITMTSSTSDHIFIAGPAVGTVSNGSQVSSWTAVQGSTGENTSSDWAGVLELTYDNSDGCYKYLNSNKTEQKISMSQGKEFIFMRNNPTDYTMEENGVTPVDLSGTSETNKEVSAYGTASKDIGDYDTQYVNYMETKENPYTATTFSSSGTSAPTSPITFNLPDGSYYVRLYWGVDSAGVSKTFYTISPRSYTFYYPTTAVGLENIDENTFKAFCDYHAVVIPHGMRAYYVTTVANTNATISGSNAVVTGIATLDSINFGSARVLPANTPVYLAEKASSTTGSSSTSSNLTKITHTDIEYYGQPWYSDASLTSSNQLVGQITKTTIPTTKTSSGTTYYNYMLGYKTATGDSKPIWGFYVPDQSSQCAINSVYLSTSTDVNSDATGAKFIALSFDGVDSETTTIEAVDAVQTVTTGDDAYYTLQGFKLTAVPTTKGIYIHNGQKVIIK